MAKYLGLLVVLLAAPSWAAKKDTVPKVDGKFVANDKWVQEYKETMSSCKAQIDAITLAIQAIPVPAFSKSAAIAAGVKSAATYAAVAGLMAKAEKAHLKMLKHIMDSDGNTDHEFNLVLKTPDGPGFEDKTDSANLKPKYDPTFKGTFRPPASSESLSIDASKKDKAGPGVPEAAPPQRQMAPVSAPEQVAKPAFQVKNSQYSYGGSKPGQSVGVGFNATLEASSVQAAYSPPSSSPGQAATNTVDTGSPSSGGIGMTAGGGGKAATVGGTGSSSTGKDADAPPSPTPHDTLSQNTSDQAQQAAERIKQRQEAARQEAERKKQEAEQKKQQKKQQRQQLMMAALMAAGQAAGQVAQAAMQSGQANSQKQGESDSAAASAPAP